VNTRPLSWTARNLLLPWRLHDGFRARTARRIRASPRARTLQCSGSLPYPGAPSLGLPTPKMRFWDGPRATTIQAHRPSVIITISTRWGYSSERTKSYAKDAWPFAAYDAKRGVSINGARGWNRLTVTPPRWVGRWRRAVMRSIVAYLPSLFAARISPSSRCRRSASARDSLETTAQK
jgi:hypothetical protein